MAVYRSNGDTAPTTNVAKLASNTGALTGVQDVAIVIRDDLGLDKTTIIQRLDDLRAVIHKDLNDVTSGDQLPVNAGTTVPE